MRMRFGYFAKPVDAMTIEDIEQLVSDRTDESLTMEFKQQLNLKTDTERAEVAKDVSAMANSAGGWLVFGVSEDKQGRATGIKPLPDKGVSDRLDRILGNSITPLPRYQFSNWLEIDGGGVLVVRIWPSDDVLHMVTAYKKYKYYKRTDRSNAPMPEPDVRLAYERIQQLRENEQKKAQEVVRQEFEFRGPDWFGVAVIPLATTDNAIDVSRVDIGVFDAPDLPPNHRWRRPSPLRMMPSAHGMEVEGEGGILRLRRDGGIAMGTDRIVRPGSAEEKDRWLPFRVIQYCICACRIARFAWPRLKIGGPSIAIASFDLENEMMMDGHGRDLFLNDMRLPSEEESRIVQMRFDSDGPDDGLSLSKAMLDRLFQEMGKKSCWWFKEDGSLEDDAQQSLFGEGT